MIPVNSLSTLILLPLTIFSAVKFHQAYKSSGDKKIGYFSKAFFSLSIALFFLSLPGIVIRNLKVIDIFYDIYILPMMFFQAYLMNVTFEILGWKKVRKIVFWFLVFGGLYISSTVFNLKEAVVGNVDRYIFWEDTRGAFRNMLTGMLMMASSLWFFFFFLWKTFAAKEKLARIRSFLLAMGMFFMTLLGLVDYIFGFLSNLLYISIFTDFFGLLFIVCFVFAILYKKPIDQPQGNPV